MPQYWMISDRLFEGNVATGAKGPLTYWVSDSENLTDVRHWHQVSADQFKDELIHAADAFPIVDQGDNDQQKHVCFFIHGYNNGFADAAARYKRICDGLFSGANSLGLCISLDWPSLGSILGYLPDRDHARACASDVATVFDALHGWLLFKQRQTASDLSAACKAKISVIAHSMGNYLVQRALSDVWKRNNQPLCVSLINQLIMVAADVDNDLFDEGSEDATDGEAVANLTYRVTALYSGRDNVLGASAGLKHFGTRRLGRSGLATCPPALGEARRRDNVWEVDCSGLIPASVRGVGVHGAYFESEGVMGVIREILVGTDRGVVDGVASSNGGASRALAADAR